ncbi:hypothetical protein ACNKHP_16030 [Shigella boydii]
MAFQIGGYEPCTVTDFEVCKRHRLEQTIADTLGPGGIMHALRYHSASVASLRGHDGSLPDATMLDYVNPMAMNTWRCMPVIRISNRSGCAIRSGTAEGWRVISISDQLRCVTAAQVSTIWRFPGAGAQNRRRRLRESLPGTAGSL